MAEIVKTIGANSRNYATIEAWAADLDNAAVYAANDDAVGVCYNDAPFTAEAVTISLGSVVGLKSIKLTVAEGHRHTGIAGTGVRLLPSGGTVALNLTSAVPTTVEWLEINFQGDTSNAGTNTGIQINKSGGTFRVSRCIIHGSNRRLSHGVKHVDGATILDNLIVYNWTYGGTSGTGPLAGIRQTQNRDLQIYNCSVYNIKLTNADNAQAAYGIAVTNASNKTLRNNIVCDVTTAGAGEALCYNYGGGTSPDSSYCLSSDGTANDGDGTGHLLNKAAANQFAVLTPGSENFHLKNAQADAYNTGTTLDAPDGVWFDIDNQDRREAAYEWSMGADSLGAAGPESHEGAASVSGGGDAEVTGEKAALGIAQVSGGGSVAATGEAWLVSPWSETVSVTYTEETPAREGTALVSVGGSVTATGHKDTSGTAQVSGGGDATATGAKHATGVAAISGGGGISASGVKGAAGQVAISGGGQVTAEGAKAGKGQAEVSGGGAVNATGRKAVAGAAQVSGGGSVLASGTKHGAGEATVSGGGSVEATGEPIEVERHEGTAQLSGGGAIAAQGSKAASGQASVSGGGEVQTAGTKAAQATVTVTGGGNVNAQGQKSASGTASVSGGGSVTAEGTTLVFREGTASVSGGGSVQAEGFKSAQGQTQVSGGGQVSADGCKAAFGVVLVSGGGGIIASGLKRLFPGLPTVIFAVAQEPLFRSATEAPGFAVPTEPALRVKAELPGFTVPAEARTLRRR